MSQFLQNTACFELQIPAGENLISLGMIGLENKTIQSLYLFSSTEDAMMFSPVSEKQITALGEVGAFGLYLNLFDTDGNHFIQDFASQNFTVESEMEHFVPYRINRKVDWLKSYLKVVRAQDGETFNLLLYVLYDDENGKKEVRESTFSETVELLPENDFQDFCLGDVALLKDISLIDIGLSERCYGYLDFKGENYRLENVPAHFFEIQTVKGFRITPMKIDLKQSFYRHRSFSQEPVQITITYGI